jgi:hypothetical protein
MAASAPVLDVLCNVRRVSANALVVKVGLQ